ncbi:carbohydrate ABC transporter permease [Paenibacillus sp. IB182496]|uniref:Carbohydrate ABC transporter permease n=1 Tax=Paenibacillus sabuli TaxID=2772509 RepID=A0A927GUN1_9BACL|nr:carbohydrate ABC transporter permease [Paenibacillus sabuli]MBD2848340.1 carbohydrate ABC transporter permease [Paenibacillus sabuli]
MIKRSPAEHVFEWVNMLLLLILAFMTLYPFIYTLSMSLSTPLAAQLPGLHLYPRELTFASYAQVFKQSGIGMAFVNTITRTVLGVAIVLVLTSLTAYPLSRRSFPHRGFLMKLYVFSMLFSGGIIPMYLLIRNLGMLNSVWALVLPTAVSAFNMIVMRNFFQAIPSEVIESAKMDGAGELRTFSSIVLPLSMPVLAVVALWAGVHHWNAWFDAMIYIQDIDKQVLQLFVRRTVIEEVDVIASQSELMHSTTYSKDTLKAATVMVATLPILFAYPFIQRFFVKGIMLGSVKG